MQDRADQGNVGEVGEGEEASLHPVVDVVVVVGDIVGDGGGLGLQRGEAVEPQIPARREVGDGAPCGLIQHVRDRAVVLDHPLYGFPAQVQAVEGRIASLKPGHDTEGLNVVIEAAPGLHPGLQFVLAGMAEGRMAQVVGQGDRLGQFAVQPQGVGQGSGDLADLQRMGQAGAIVVALMGHEDLGLALQAAEGGGVDDPVAVAGEGVARTARRLGNQASTRVGGQFGIGGAGVGLAQTRGLLMGGLCERALAASYRQA